MWYMDLTIQHAVGLMTELDTSKFPVTEHRKTPLKAIHK